MTALIGEDKKKAKRIIARGSYTRGYFRATSVNKLIIFFFLRRAVKPVVKVQFIRAVKLLYRDIGTFRTRMKHPLLTTMSYRSMIMLSTITGLNGV